MIFLRILGSDDYSARSLTDVLSPANNKIRRKPRHFRIVKTRSTWRN
jgi:hypothetical protein